MNTAMQKRRRIVVLLAAAALASLLVVVTWLVMREDCPTSHALFSGPSYSSIYTLSGASDAVIVGTVKGIVACKVDYGTGDFFERLPARLWGFGIPFVFYEVEVTETLQGDVGGTILVSMIDVARVTVSVSTTALRPGEQVLLFLVKQTHSGITSYDFSYAPVGADNGVFDVLADGQVVPRIPKRFGASSYTLDEVRERIQR